MTVQLPLGNHTQHLHDVVIEEYTYPYPRIDSVYDGEVDSQIDQVVRLLHS